MHKNIGKVAVPKMSNYALFQRPIFKTWNKMYRALYKFSSSDHGALSFKENDKFTVLEARDEHWWLVQNGFGNIGYIPKNYVKLQEV